MSEKPLISIGENRHRGSTRRLDRRDFTFLLVGWVTTLGSMVAASVAAVRGLVPNLLDEPDLRFRAAKPNEYLDGVSTFLSDIRVFIQRKGSGYRAMSGVCTHLGCTVNSATGHARGFSCPCHGSVFDQDGRVLEGPAPKDLPFFEVSQARDGRLIVDREQEIPPDQFLVLDTESVSEAEGEVT